MGAMVSGGPVELRAYRREDFEALYRLDCVCFERPFRFSRAMMRRVVGAPGAAVVVAAEGDEVVGFGAAEVEGERAYVATLDVAPGWRGRGIGRALMERLEQLAEGAGALEMGLHVYVENGSAVRLYEGLGYARLGREAGFYGRGLDAWLYRRRLG